MRDTNERKTKMRKRNETPCNYYINKFYFILGFFLSHIVNVFCMIFLTSLYQTFIKISENFIKSQNFLYF